MTVRYPWESYEGVEAIITSLRGGLLAVAPRENLSSVQYRSRLKADLNYSEKKAW